MSTPGDQERGRVVGGRYRLTTQIGSGAMGTVWSGYDEVLQRRVAVKELKVPHGFPSREALAMRERMLREARALGGLSHPNVITVFDVVAEGGEPMVVLEMLPSRNLAALIAEHRTLSQEQAAAVGYATAAALRAAHRAGITHRDVKPGNVLVAHDGRIKLTDFGIARNSADAPMTTAGLVLGSPAYIAPEVAAGQAVTPAADLWGLGATLFAAIEGRPPYDVKGDPVSTITEVVDGDVPRPLQPGPVSDVIAALMVKEPERRMPLDEVRRRLRPLIADPDDPLYPGEDESPPAYLPAVSVVPTPAVSRSQPGPVAAAPRSAVQAPPRSAPLAAAPGPLPAALARPGGPEHRQAARPGPLPAQAPRAPQAGMPAWLAGVLAAAGAVLVLVGAAAGYGVTRALGGQSPLSTVTVTDADDARERHVDPLGFSVDVPSGWSEQRTVAGETPVVRFLSPDGGEDLTVWRATGQADVIGGLTAEGLGVEELAAEPPTATEDGGQQVRYSTTAGGTERVSVLRTYPDADGVWVLSLGVPAGYAGERSDGLFDAVAAGFTAP